MVCKYCKILLSKKCYHIFKVNIDGGNLVQLTDGKSQYGGYLLSNTSQNDFDPVWLPRRSVSLACA